MIWRSLSLQALQFARDGTSVLGAAATEQRLPWYREIQERPGWVSRHRVQGLPGPEAEVQAKAQWSQVAELMAASERNHDIERDKLIQERKLVAKLKRNRTWMLALSAIIVLLIAAGTGAFSLMALDQKRDVQLQLYLYQTHTAYERANVYCGTKKGRDKDSCVQSKAARFSNSWPRAAVRPDPSITNRCPRLP